MLRISRFATVAACIFAAALFAGCVQPALGKSTMTMVDVGVFGAVRDDGKDDTSAVLAALDECAKHDASTLFFPKGVYNFAAGSNAKSPGTLFPVASCHNLTIDGRGSRLILSGMTGVFAFANCKSPAITNLVIDWDRPPFSVGRVLSAADRRFDVQIEPEYPVKGGEPVEAFMDYDPETRLPLNNGLDEYYTVEKTELLREQVLRVHLRHEARIRPGVLVVLRHKVYGHNAIVCSRCSDVKVSDVTVHTTPGMGFIGSVCTNVTLERFRVVPQPGSGRIMSATADATHFGGCKGTIRMEGCEYEGMGDDGVNIKSGLYISLKKKENDRTVIAAHNLKIVDSPDPGDLMEIAHVDDLLTYATARVKRLEVLPNDGLQRVEFEAPLPASLREGDVFGNAARTPKVRIHNCQVRNNRARGMLIQTRDAAIEKCLFRNCTGPGIMVLTEVTHFFESIGTRDVTVRKCTFDHCNYGAATGPGALCAMAYLANMSFPPKPGIHKNVVFDGNTISRTNNSAIFAAGVDGITIRGNRIYGASDSPNTPSGSSPIYLMSSRGIKIEANRVEAKEQGKGITKMLAFGDGADQAGAVVKANTGF